MIIKAWYKLDGEVVKSVRFEADKDMQPEDIKVIHSNAPKSGYWDECVWDHGTVLPIERKKRKPKEVSDEPKSDDGKEV
tara:strand:+ start:2854 stop:3090 length:237 start_codon:yes stop_codon:yes gene_type:complete